MVNVNWPTAVVGEADNVSSVSASACHIGGPIDVNHGEQTLVYGILYRRMKTLILTFQTACSKSAPATVTRRRSSSGRPSNKTPTAPNRPTLSYSEDCT